MTNPLGAFARPTTTPPSFVCPFGVSPPSDVAIIPSSSDAVHSRPQ
jgi:hypothetical protein